MGLLSFNKRQDDSGQPGHPGEGAPDAVTHARTRARRRLIGATVLLGIGVVGFPLVFETQPRPIPVDVPIEIPRRENAPPLVMPPAQGAASMTPATAPTTTAAPALPTATAPQARAVPDPVPGPAPAPAGAAPAPAPASPAPVITERATEQGREVVAPARPASAARPPASAPATAAAARPASAAPQAAGALTPRTDDAQRVQALLEGRSAASKPADAAAGARLIVQVGAYTDADKLREARQKVEKLGLKTYTQVVEADGGKRTRVRVGPFNTRDEADKAAARIKAAGLPVAVLSL